MTEKNLVQDDLKANGILKFILERGRGTRRQIAWLIGYVDRLQKRSRPQARA